MPYVYQSFLSENTGNDADERGKSESKYESCGL